MHLTPPTPTSVTLPMVLPVTAKFQQYEALTEQRSGNRKSACQTKATEAKNLHKCINFKRKAAVGCCAVNLMVQVY